MVHETIDITANANVRIPWVPEVKCGRVAKDYAVDAAEVVIVEHCVANHKDRTGHCCCIQEQHPFDVHVEFEAMKFVHVDHQVD